LMGVKYAKSRWLKAYEQEKGEMGGV